MNSSRPKLLGMTVRDDQELPLHELKKPNQGTVVFGTLDQYRVTYKIPIRNIYDFEVNKRKYNGQT